MSGRKENLILSLNNAKNFLKNKNEEGNSVYEHICELINFIIVEQPEHCYEQFEIISNHIKENKHNYKKLLENEKKKKDKNNNFLEEYVLNEYIKKKKEWVDKVKSTFLKNAKLKPKKMPYLADMNEQVKLMNWAGYSINNNFIYFINESTKHILEKFHEHLASLHFWGIIKGIEKDYYILEGELKIDSDVFNTKKLKLTLNGLIDEDADKETGDDEEEQEEEEEETEEEEEETEEEEEEEESVSNEDEEDISDEEDGSKQKRSRKEKRKVKKQKGNKKKKNQKIFCYKKEDYEFFNKNVNKYIYFVSIDGVSEWIFLNFVDPETIKIAQKIQKICTGNLEHIITSYPNIIIQEKKYLRALIAIISAETHIVPKNYYTTDKENKKKKKNRKDSDEEEEEADEEDEEEEEEKEEEEDDIDNAADENKNGSYKEKRKLVKNKNFQFDLNSLAMLNNWVYYKYGFLKNGHINYPINAKIGKNKKNKKMQQIIKKNKPLKILRNIIEDKNPHHWKINHLNAGHYYGKEKFHYDILVIYNMLFYGAFTIYFNKQFSNFYIGTGVKSFDLILHTYAPGKVQSDQSELSEVECIETT